MLHELRGVLGGLMLQSDWVELKLLLDLEYRDAVGASIGLGGIEIKLIGGPRGRSAALQSDWVELKFALGAFSFFSLVLLQSDWVELKCWVGSDIFAGL